jgi:beta-glucosidase-like glycosyl hydrolase
MRYKIHAWHRKRKSVMSSLCVVSCLLLLSGCSILPANISSLISPSQVTTKPLPPTPTLSPAELALQREQAKAQSMLKGMSQDDKLAQMIMVEFVGVDYVSTGLQQMVAQQHVGGVLYQPTQYGNGNFEPPCDTRDCAHAFSEQIISDDPTAPLIAIDEEGGLVDKISQFFGPSPFQGVIITDGMYMGGLYNGAYPTDAQLTQTCVQAIEAGNDMIEGPSTPAQINDIITALNVAIQQGTLSQSQIDQSVMRILMMKLQYGIIK